MHRLQVPKVKFALNNDYYVKLERLLFLYLYFGIQNRYIISF